MEADSFYLPSITNGAGWPKGAHMARTTFTAIDPNGATHKRTSESRTYTHTVVARYNKAGRMAHATSKGHADLDGRNYDYAVECAAGTHPHVTHVTPASGYHPSYSAEFIAEAQAGQRAENARAIERAKAIVSVSREQYLANQLAERVARVEAADFNEFHNLGWCGRPDLAQKLAAKQSGSWFKDITILEAKAGA